MFEKVLIANRGEIAIRVIRALRELGIKSVAVYSTADKDAQHVKEADEAICIGGPQPADSYLNMENIVSAALLTGAQAIHPGYGFLSESAEFAQLCTDCQLKFIGPAAKTITLMGNKANARETMRQNHVPVIPGSKGFVKDAETALVVANQVGFPVMLKAVSGGGGKGIRQVDQAEDLTAAFLAAQKEAKLSFGDDRMYLEKIISPAKHIEVQILADQSGHVVALPERDCSMQRNHQKVIEETPCSQITAEERTYLQTIAVKAIKAIKYENVGTIEFLMDPEHHFYFMEMNTRIQVEHSITEEVAEFDLVKAQLEIAAGQDLKITQDQVKVHGAAIEARINAEDPVKNFRPQAGKIKQMALPGGLGIRIESGVNSGDTVSPFYDSMIIKIIAHADNRNVAINRLLDALTEFNLQGLTTNRNFLLKLLQDSTFNRGDYLITYLDEEFLPQYIKDNQSREEAKYD
ncbi:acetyl-CoA carboxylase biotin carboxylase subunit [Lactobacillus sp. ESL0681]|uniref:acetyl-CoA carboxylase biotin carboxylase subunit n=1 Tax=Lactobacillus sp. ESL0681 TaxID=2983211 RepID=UPI0023F9D9A5|nr:acetyl-CoA carboxylase biotin carboxylase subunit [Lactobacillus sp. ESL0681]WEV40501.1 acetyl-CoA carboxylase biotin carboxylase subunit [Lactobacillus sp. ESL0681]